MIRKILFRIFLTLLTISVLCVSGVLVALGMNLRMYRLHWEDKETWMPGVGWNIERVCAEAGLDEGYAIKRIEEGKLVTQIWFAPRFLVTVQQNNQTRMVKATQGDTVQDVLSTLGVKLGADDVVAPEPDTVLEASTHITVVTVTHSEVEETIEIPFHVEIRESAELEKGYLRVMQMGQAGRKRITYDVTAYDGLEVAWQPTGEHVESEPVNKIVEVGIKEPPPPDPAQQNMLTPGRQKTGGSLGKTPYTRSAGMIDLLNLPGWGTSETDVTWTPGVYATGEGKSVYAPAQPVVAENGVLTLPDGQKVRYRQALNVRATAYHRAEEGGQITAMGTRTARGTVAVDPKVIPLGSKVFVSSPDGSSWVYGTGVASDTGGLIKGNKIDLFFETYAECYDFGVRDATIYVLE